MDARRFFRRFVSCLVVLKIHQIQKKYLGKKKTFKGTEQGRIYFDIESPIVRK